MHLSAALTILVGALAATTFTRASDSLSLKDHKSIIRTAATSEESSQYSDIPVGPSSTNDSFAGDQQKQWKTNKNLGADIAAPYLVCDFTAGTGRSRVKHIVSICNLPNIGDHSVQNLPERTCFDAQLLYTDAVKCAAKSDFVAVVPHTAWTKISYEELTASFGDGFNPTVSNQVATETARYAGIICPDNSEAIKNLQSVVKNVLMRDYRKTDSCTAATPAALVSVRGFTTKFEDAFAFTARNSRLQLHQKDNVSVNYKCLMTLVASLAEHPFVCSVEYDPKVVLFNNKGRWIMQGRKPNQKLPFHEVGITGLGQTVQMSDTGLSVDSCYFYDETGAVVRDKSGTVDRSRRKVVQYYAEINSEDEDGHGTHCAGTILGKICTGDKCVVEDEGGVNREGSAPDAKIAVYDIGCKPSVANCGLYPDTADPMFKNGMLAGATVHSASWGEALAKNSYSSQDKDFDKFQYENPSFLVVFAAGNSGYNGWFEDNPRYNIKNSSSSVAKNNLLVCASKNDGQGLGQNYIAYFSSMGPSFDGRMKPDICAPGMVINSAASTTNGRQCTSNALSGTSMAAPGVAGSALLLRQYFMDGFYPSGTKVSSDTFIPTGYLIKAAILNSGRPMLGRDNADNNNDKHKGEFYRSEQYDESQGFGLISLIDAVYIDGESMSKVLVWDQVELGDGNEWEELIDFGSCDATHHRHISVTMAYFDKEATSRCVSCMTNRLDLTVVKESETLYPNGLTGHDTKNNAQRIRFLAGTFSIKVRVKAENLISESQKFALVVSGCGVVATYPPTKMPSVLATYPPTKMPTGAPTCFEDPDFAITRGFAKKGLQRTCAYFGEKKYRMKKWCNKKYRGQPIREICCVTCARLLSKFPSMNPSMNPSKSLSKGPTKKPSMNPSKSLSKGPTKKPLLFCEVGHDVECGGCQKNHFAGQYNYCDKSNPDNNKKDCDLYGGPGDCKFPAKKSVSFEECYSLCQAEDGCTHFVNNGLSCNLHLVSICKKVKQPYGSVTLYYPGSCKK